MANNDYNTGNYQRPRFFGGFSFFPPVIKTLLIINIGIFILDRFFLGAYHIAGSSAREWMAYLYLWPVNQQPVLGHQFHVWQLITYQFLHSGFDHVLFNMFGLWMFGMELEHKWGSRQFLFYYLFCGIGAGLATLYIAPIFSPAAPTIGASGAVFGVLAAFGLLFPDRLIYFYFFLPIKAKYFVILLILLEIFAVGSGDRIAHLAHLGGAVCGIIYIITEHRTGIFSRMGDWAEDLFHGIRSSGARHSTVHLHHGATDNTIDEKKKEERRASQKEIDAVLDKISKHGYESLTEEEKKTLTDASKKIH